jgi:hypothetical protein
MRAIIVSLAALLLAASAAPAQAQTAFSYRGKKLMPKTGNGVPGTMRLRFDLSGRMPAKGTCSADFTVLRLEDGATSLQALLAQGFTEAPGNGVEICSDATTGALSERLRIQLVLQSDDSLIASYTWQSVDPKWNGMADTVTLFANVEYHVSASAKAGRLGVQAAGAGGA